MVKRLPRLKSRLNFLAFSSKRGMYKVAMEKKNKPRPRLVTNPNIRCFLESEGKQSFLASEYQLEAELDSLSLSNASSSSATLFASLLPKTFFNDGRDRFLKVNDDVDFPLLK